MAQVEGLRASSRGDALATAEAPVGRGAWMALLAALLGWMFDGAEMGVFSMVGRPAITDLFGYATPISPEDEKNVGLWIGIITAGFLVGAATGGVLFGWLGDRIGRVRAMTLSVFTYAVFTGLCGLAWTPGQVGALRFIASLGMGGEWSLGVALVMEVWPNRSRAFMAGLIGAAANVGYLLVGFVGLGLAAMIENVGGWLGSLGLPPEMVTKLTAHSGWRLIMIVGTLPALLTFFIRIFVPESKKWEKEKGAGKTDNWATRDLFGVLLGAAGPGLIVWLWADARFSDMLAVRIAGTLLGLAVATIGYTYPVVRYLQRQTETSGDGQRWQPTLRRMMLAACLSGVALLGTWGGTQQTAVWAAKLTQNDAALGIQQNAREHTLIWLSVGAIVGTILAAMMGDWLGRRKTYFLMCVAALASVYLLFLTNTQYDNRFLFCAFVNGVCAASFYGWLPLYLPELFRTNVRATGQGFGFNFGRILAAVGTVQIGALLGVFSQEFTIPGINLTIPAGYPAVCSTLCLVYLVGMVIIWFAPETKGKSLPE